MGGKFGRVEGAVRAALAATGISPFIPFALPGTVLAVGLGRVFALQCHGRLERTIGFAGHLFPICSRCLGIYVGLLVGALLPLHSLSPGRRRGWLLVAAMAMVIEVYVQDASGHPPFHAARLATGVLLAWPVAQIVVAAARES